MTGTLAGALEARQIAAYDGLLETDADGTIEEGEGKVLLLTKVHINYRLKIPTGKRAQAERALALHHSRCPVSQSVERGIRVEWSADITEV
jgi:organic hydroperoxide reductase OsmC/OhrA